MDTSTPPDDKHRWFPAYLMRGFTVASVHPGGSIHDFLEGWGHFSTCGEWFHWESGWVPRPTAHNEIKFDKITFPVIKNYKWPDLDIRDILLP